MTEKADNRNMAILLGLVFMALMLASLGLRFWATHAMLNSAGPTHIAAHEQRVLIHANDFLYELSADGHMAASHGPGLTGLDGDLIDLRILDNGQVLLAQQRPARLRACDLETWVCIKIDASLEGVIDRQFKIVSVIGTGTDSSTDSSTDSGPASSVNIGGGDMPGEWLLTDARGDALWQASSVNSGPVALLQSGELAGPNDLAIDDHGNVWIVDTNHRRIVEWQTIRGAALRAGRQHSTVNALTRDERHFPMMLAADGQGRWWLIQASEFSDGKADVVIYDPDAGPVSRVELPGSVYPTDLARSEGRMLISDLESFVVLAVDENSLQAERFGDEPFLSAMAEFEVRRKNLEGITVSSLVGLIVFAMLMIGAGIYATPKGRRITPPPSAMDFDATAEFTPATAGIHWLAKNPALQRAVRVLAVINFILPVLVVAGGVLLVALFRDQISMEMSSRLIILPLALVVPLVSVFLAIRHVQQLWRNQLGSDGKHIWVRLHDGRSLNIQPRDAAHNGRAVFYRNYMLPLAGGKGQAIYVDGEVDTWLTPLLREATTYTVAQALAHRWRYREAQLMTALTLVLVMAVVLALLLILQLRLG